MAKWLVQKTFKGKLKLKNPILVEGLPGVGNVGKIALDYLVDTLKPELLYRIHSSVFPHSVFFNEDGFVELPSVSIYRHKGKTRDILLLTGDVQPTRESASYEFCEKILDFAEEVGCSEVVTLGGIGMPSEIKNPIIFGAFTDQDIKAAYKKFGGINTKTPDKIEAIVGASGLLLGLARLRNMRGASLLSETYAHENHFGFKEAKHLLERLKPIIGLNLKLENLEKEIQFVDEQEKLFSQSNKAVRKAFKQAYDKLDLKYIG